eukprot:TRINITY_DN164_c0_g2_i1.p1 TRINITY_DN164_c0_g2~~TRINITY_DN164_c0_g2_i1.p1  ORF type:complete len:326 (-),score=69.09 TRINITY_DN164_c0_g2_i1:32-1009(-)
MEIEQPVSKSAAEMQEEDLQLALLNLQNYAPSGHVTDSSLVGHQTHPSMDMMGVESVQYQDPMVQHHFQQQLQQQLQQQQLQQQLQQLMQQQFQQQQSPLAQNPHTVIPPTHVPLNNDDIDMSKQSAALAPPVVPPPEFHQIVYAITPPLYVYPSMFSSFMYPMMMPDPGYSMGHGYSGSPGSPDGYQASMGGMKIRKSPKDSSKKKQTRKTLWIPLSVENVFLNWFEKVGSTQYRCKRDACVGLIEAIAEAGDIEEWIPEAQKTFNEDSKRKGRDLIWDKLNELGKTFCDEKRTWSLTFSAAVLKYCLAKDPSMMHSAPMLGAF